MYSLNVYRGCDKVELNEIVASSPPLKQLSLLICLTTVAAPIQHPSYPLHIRPGARPLTDQSNLYFNFTAGI